MKGQTNIKKSVIIKQKPDLNTRIKNFLVDNMVTILFVILCYIGFKASGLSTAFYLNDIITRIARNSFLVLALIIPVLAGMGLNFAIVLGAMAGQTVIIAVTHWGITGWQGLLLCAVLATPIAMLFGYLTGKLLNKTKGQEMITSLILGFFANGIYQFVFLILVGSVIPMNNEALVLSSGVGIRTTIDLTDGLKYGLDDLVKRSLPVTILFLSSCLLLYVLYTFYKNRSKAKSISISKNIVYGMMGILLAGWSIYIMNSNSMIKSIQVPVATIVCIGLLCLFNVFISKTKLGQDFRTVGQDQHIATVSGIASNKMRVTAIILSTVLAAWGQIIYLQNLGTFSTYGSHEQVGMFAIAALLIGGASVTKATIGQALLGTVLFHTLFIVSPLAGRNIFGDAQLGEFFRSFVAYGVIGVSLGMHAWRKQIEGRRKLGV